MMNELSFEKDILKNKFSILILPLVLAIAILMGVFSGLGMIFSDVIYPTPGLRETYLANDPVNIVLGLPFLLASVILIQKGKILGLLLLPGALIYVIYNYLGYALGRPLGWLSLAYLGLAGLSLAALTFLIRTVDHKSVKSQLEERIGRKLSGWILVVFGLAFIALALSTIVTGIQEGTIPPLGENAVAVADIVVSLGWVVGGILLLRGKPLGYTVGLGLLVAASSLFIGLVLFFFFAPLVSDRPFDWKEIVTVLAMGLICFVPTVLFWRGVVGYGPVLNVKEIEDAYHT